MLTEAPRPQVSRLPGLRAITEVESRFGTSAGQALGRAFRQVEARADPRVCDVLDQKLPFAVSRVRDAKELLELLDLLVELTDLESEQYIEIASRFEFLFAHLSPRGLRRWVVTGLRCYESQPAALLRYLRLEDSMSAQCLSYEESGGHFEQFQGYLQHYVDGFLGAHVQLSCRRASALNGPPLRPVVAEGGVFLPEGYTPLDGPEPEMLYRAAVAHAIGHLLYSPRRQAVGGLKPMSIAVISLIEDARVEHLMAQSYPGLRSLWGRFHRGHLFRQSLSFRALMMRLSLALHDPGYADDNYWVNKGAQLYREQLSQSKDCAAFRRIGSILANDLGQMRVRFLPQQYAVEPAYRDDNSFLWDFGDADQSLPQEEPLHLDAVRLELEQRDEPSDAAMQAVRKWVESSLAESEPTFHYPEWDFRASADRRDWVTVIERPPPPGPARRLEIDIPRMREHRTIFSLVKANRLNRALKLTRQWEGDDLDLNAAVGAQVALRSGLPPDPRIFKRAGRRAPHPAILVLLDISESTNDRIFGRFESVLDVVKEASIVLGAAVQESAERMAIHAFCSNGRHDVSYYRVKDFDDPFGAGEQNRVLALKGGYSTRIGAALRHAGWNLGQEPCDKRILLLVTDGEPADIDVKDPEYLVEDAARAVRELSGAGIICYCLTADKKAERYVTRIFDRNYLLIEDIRKLALQLSRVFVRLLNK